ncbi:MAG: hypothetical protein D6739_00945, partial [Nitrospirae bacterium]
HLLPQRRLPVAGPSGGQAARQLEFGGTVAGGHSAPLPERLELRRWPLGRGPQILRSDGLRRRGRGRRRLLTGQPDEEQRRGEIRGPAQQGP